MFPTHHLQPELGCKQPLFSSKISGTKQKMWPTQLTAVLCVEKQTVYTINNIYLGWFENHCISSS